jgi:hypothetical protein
MKWIIAVSVSLILNLGLVALGRGSFLAVFLPMVTSLWIGLPLLILSVVFYFASSHKKLLPFGHVSLWGIAIAVIIFSTLLSIPAGKRILAGDMAEAQSFCNSLVDHLEQSKSQSGEYPRDISSVLKGQRLPSLLRPGFFKSDGAAFSFIITDPGDIMGGIVFSSQTKSWGHWD